jgi:hypothetical protein
MRKILLQKLQAPNTKLQKNTKLQNKLPRIGASLELGS